MPRFACEVKEETLCLHTVDDELPRAEVVNETEVEVCLELARMYDEEDLTHPPHRPCGEEWGEG